VPDESLWAGELYGTTPRWLLAWGRLAGILVGTMKRSKIEESLSREEAAQDMLRDSIEKSKQLIRDSDRMLGTRPDAGKGGQTRA